ncbi:MAG: 50S ribosomal protein L22 [Candidatus Colwellbacteria bacterium]|nr:50S ribosomal protein L22 [Candidatus Colwellbacteria bacterium]
MAEVTAKINKLDIAPRKVRALTRLISGLAVGDAEAQLMFRKERSTRPMLKLLKSAIANARVKGLNVDSLMVKTAFVDKGPRMKRWLPRARGMATPLHKDFSHVTIVLAESDKKSRFKVALPEMKKVSDKTEKKITAPKKIVKKKVDDKKETKEAGKKIEATPGPLKKVFKRKSV